MTVLGAANEKNNGSFLIDEASPDRLTLGGGVQLIEEPAGAAVTLQVGSVGPAFLIFTIVCIFSLLFGLMMMPETKGRSLEEIGASWQK